MNCIVCDGLLSYFFEKDFGGSWSLDKVEYWKCSRCGLVIAKTLYEMPQQRWEALNRIYHASLFELDSDTDPRWAMRSRGIERLHKQAEVIDILDQMKVLSIRLPWIDYGCGNGVLADELAERQLPVYKFEPYVQGKGYLCEEFLEYQQFSLVINTCVFEHVRGRAALDKIVGLVADDGVLALHTFVCEAVPKDPDWFYLLPVHCTMFTNNSMQRLFEQWGFVASLYHVPSRMWFWFRKKTEVVNALVGFHARDAFVDYWKE